MLRTRVPRMAAMLLLVVAMMMALIATPPSSSSPSMFANAQLITNLTTSTISQFSLQPGASNYYRVNCDVQGYSIAVVVTALYGEPDMYWSTTTWYPSPTNNQGSSTQDGSDIFAVSNCQVGSYYVSVYASDLYAATYTIQAQIYNPINPQNNPRTLLTTLPQNDILSRVTWRYYSLQLTAASTMLNIYLSSRVGDPDLFVLYSTTNNIATVYPTRETYNWSSTAWGSDLLAIPNANAGYYFIGVYAYTDTAYQISAAVAEQALTMSDGATYGRQVQQGTYVYYTFNVASASTTLDLFFISTAMSGDPDLYISRTIQRPNQTAYDWRSTSGSAVDVIALYGAQGEVQAGPYYIGVYGWSTARFTIMASLQARANLVSGTATAGALVANGLRVYQLDVAINQAISWTVTTVATYGYTTLYLGQNPRIDPDDWSTYTYTSSSLSATTQSISVPGSYCVTRYSNTSNVCRMYVLARAPDQPSGYQIIASSSASYTTLVPSQPTVLTTVPVGQYRFYQFTNALQYANISIQVTANAGNPDLFVGRIRPITSGNALLSSTAVGADRVAFSWNDPRLGGQAITGTWFVAIYGTSAASFTVLVTVNDTSSTVRPVPLAVGTVQRAVVAAQATSVYRVTLARTNNAYPTLYVSLTPISGDPDLTVVNELTGLSITSTMSGQDIITIPPTSPVACTATNATCVFSVRVYGWSRSDYVIVASTTGTLALVSNRVATAATVASRSWTYYMFINPSPSTNAQMELALSLTQQYGNPDLYVSSVFPPSQTNYNWSSANAVGGDFVTISPVALSQYYVGVYANSATLAAFSLYSDLYNKSAPQLSAVALSLGYSLQGATSVRNYRYYTLSLFANPAPRYLLISLVALVGDPDLYVTTTQADGTNVWPTTTTYRWASAAGGSDYLYIPNPNSTTYRIGVYAFSNSLYQLSATTASTRPLSDGVQVSSVATTATPTYFSFTVAQLVANASLTFSITPTAGNPDLFVSRSLSELEAGRSTWNSTQGSGFDIVRINSRTVQVGTYYVKVASATGTGSSSFSILASYASAVTLVDGLSVFAYAPSSGSQYFRVTYQGPLTYPVVITVTPLYGVPFVYATTQASVEPSPTEYEYRDVSTTSTPHTVTIPASRCNTATLCTFNVMVLGSSATYYSIVSATQGTYSQLSQGTVESGTLATGSARFFRFTVSDQFSNVTLTLNAQSGNPDLYVRRTQPVGPSQYDWSSANASTFGIDVVYFDWRSPLLTNPMNTYTYYVAVYARTQSTYTLRLKVDSSSALVRTPLTANVPVGGYVRQGGSDVFSFSATAAYVTSPLRFALFTAVGNADLIVTCPSTSGTWTSSTSGTFADVIMIYPDDPKACTNPTNQNPCVYYVDVKGTLASTYTVQAQVLNMETRVYSSVAQVAWGQDAGSWRYYVFSDVVLPPNGKQLSFIVTPYAGNPDLYVSMVQRPSKTVYNWSSTLTTEEYVWVGTPTSQSYWVGIYVEGSQPATYSLMVEYLDPSNPQRDAPTLDQWSVQNGRLQANQWRYYTFAPRAPFTHLSFAAIAPPSSGNPDVYVSSSVLSGTAFPTVARHDWSSQEDGNDVLIVPTSSDAVYRIGVFGETTTFFTLVAAAANVMALPSVGSSLVVVNVRSTFGVTFSSYVVDVTGGSFSITVRASSEMYLTISQDTVFPMDASVLTSASTQIPGGETRTVTLDNIKSGKMFIALVSTAGESEGATLVSVQQSASASSSSSSVNGGAIAAGILVPLVVIALAVVLYRYYQANGHLPFMGSRSSGSSDGHMEMNPRSNSFSRGGGMPSSRLLDDDHADSSSSGSESSYRPPTRS